MDTTHKTSLRLAELSKLAPSALSALPSATLASALLSLSARKGLIEIHASHFEIIFSLAAEKSETLSFGISLISALSPRQAKRIPRWNADHTESLQTWLTAIRDVLNSQEPIAAASRNSIAFSSPQAKSKGIIHKSLDNETRIQAKELIAALIEDGIISAQLSLLFKQSVKGENLIYTSDSLRSSLISHLQKFPDSADAATLIGIYQQTAKNRTMQERITLTQLEGENESASDSFDPSSVAVQLKKRSISEIIADRKAQLEKAKIEASKPLPQLMNEIAAELDLESEAEGRYLITSGEQQEQEQNESNTSNLSDLAAFRRTRNEEADSDAEAEGEYNEIDLSPELLSWAADSEDSGFDPEDDDLMDEIETNESEGFPNE